MRGMNSDSVDLIYLDPPFNSKRQYQGVIAINGKKRTAQFRDTWTINDITIDEYDHLEERCPEAAELIDCLGKTHGKSWKAYLTFMGARLVEMHRLLKDTGSIYLHCDKTMAHGLKLLMDCIFGGENFRNDVVWCYHAGGASKKTFPSKHDNLLLYGKDAKKSTHNILRIPYRDWDAYREEGAKFELYHKDGKMLHDWWEIGKISSISKENTGWPTQKPLALLKQVIKVSSNIWETVLDPFCGCATACVAAAQNQRQWIGIDLESQAAAIMQDRMKNNKEKNLLDEFHKCKIRNIVRKPSGKKQDEKELLEDLPPDIEWQKKTAPPHRCSGINRIGKSGIKAGFIP